MKEYLGVTDEIKSIAEAYVNMVKGNSKINEASVSKVKKSISKLISDFNSQMIKNGIKPKSKIDINDVIEILVDEGDAEGAVYEIEQAFGIEGPNPNQKVRNLINNLEDEFKYIVSDLNEAANIESRINEAKIPSERDLIKMLSKHEYDVDGAEKVIQSVLNNLSSDQVKWVAGQFDMDVRQLAYDLAFGWAEDGEYDVDQLAEILVKAANK